MAESGFAPFSLVGGEEHSALDDVYGGRSRGHLAVVTLRFTPTPTLEKVTVTLI
jgi:hypothetical protein